MNQNSKIIVIVVIHLFFAPTLLLMIKTSQIIGVAIGGLLLIVFSFSIAFVNKDISKQASIAHFGKAKVEGTRLRGVHKVDKQEIVPSIDEIEDNLEDVTVLQQSEELEHNNSAAGI